MKHIYLFIFTIITTSVFSQEKKVTNQEIEVNSLIKGTLFSPEKVSKKNKLVILIAGSGPTNRNGNQVGTQNNSLKFLAEGLTQNGFAVFSYDKRIFAQMIAKTLDEKTLSFEDFIKDAKDVVTYFKSQKKYDKIIIAGHSEGSLIGMVAAQDNVDGYISLAGAGRPADELITEQVMQNSPSLKEAVEKDFAILKEGKTFENKNPMLASIFRESVQPYMISWIKYHPQNEIKKLSIPILIINGTTDIQVPPSDAELLHTANPKSELKIIENMNHIFKEIKMDDDNIKSYSDPKLPVIPELIHVMTLFINSI